MENRHWCTEQACYCEYDCIGYGEILDHNAHLPYGGRFDENENALRCKKFNDLPISACCGFSTERETEALREMIKWYIDNKEAGVK